MAAPPIVLELVERFDSHQDAYRSGQYNEAQLRQEFLNPFFAALGWDVYNERSHAEAYKEVIHEAAIKVGGRTKAPDYCFRVGGGVPTFFVEAKKPSVSIRDAVSPAYQLRRYAWSAKLPVSILTDFEEWAVYDCRIRPAQTDRASTARVMYHTYDQYPDCWDELYGLFSPEAIRRGALDKFVTSKRVKKGTAEVDDAFLDDIQSWREMLARNIALRDPELSQRDLNFAVQRTIDRIVFLRICEDRGIEPYGTLQALQNGPNVYPRLAERFQRADERYNSGLFHFNAEKGRADPPDELTLALAIDDKPLKAILGDLYYPESPYEFSVFPAEILGHVYEQFLGKVIRLTAGHRAVVEDKPEVKKAGGVYYTPTYIVDYIVEHTVGKLLHCDGAARSDPIHRVEPSATGQQPHECGHYERAWRKSGGITPKEAARLRILDPACGSGSFLIGAYQHLLDWHQRAYVEDDPEKHARGRAPKLYRGRSGDWRLTTAERKRILLNNIYGVDIDPQAVEVTKLSLLLKVLEGESQETLESQLRLFHERALPDLASNVKCGNSLIGPDFYEGRQMSLLDEEEVYRINAFDWRAEFPEVFAGKNGGFDAVIGNPPYGAIFAAQETQYLLDKSALFRATQDAYVAFIDQSHHLLAAQGRFGFIVPSAWLGGPNYGVLRAFLLSHEIDSVIVLPFDVFKDAYIDTVLVTTKKKPASPDHSVRAYEFPKRSRLAKIDMATLPTSRIAQTRWLVAEDSKFVVNPGMLSVLTAIREHTRRTFADVVEMKRGVLFDKSLLTESCTSDHSYRYFEGDVYRYVVNLVRDHWVEYGAKMREYPRDFKWFEGERILLRRLVNRQQRLMASVVTHTMITNKNLYTALRLGAESTWYVLALLNSRLTSRLYLCQVSQARKDDFPQVTIRDVLALPIPDLDMMSDTGRLAHDQLSQIVERMLGLQASRQSAKTDHQKTVLQRQIDTTDREIDRLVYELYGLSEEEIAIVEEATP